MEPLLGRGLLTSDGASWREQKRSLAPEFHSGALTQYHKTLLDVVDSVVEKWAGEINISHAMHTISFRAVSRILLGGQIESRFELVSQALREATERALRKFIFPIPRPRWLPSDCRETTIFFVGKAQISLNAEELRLVRFESFPPRTWQFRDSHYLVTMSIACVDACEISMKQ